MLGGPGCPRTVDSYVMRAALLWRICLLSWTLWRCLGLYSGAGQRLGLLGGTLTQSREEVLDLIRRLAWDWLLHSLVENDRPSRRVDDGLALEIWDLEV